MTRSYFNNKAALWDERIAEKNPDKLESMAKNLDIQLGSTVLDVGAGTGVFVPFLLEKVGSAGKIVCLDFAEKMLEQARAKNFNGNIDYVCADIADTRLGDESFDAAVCYSSFPHFHDKTKALKEINRVLKTGGKLLICHTSSRAAINEIHANVPELRADLIPEDGEMRKLLAETGFGEISINIDPDSYVAKAKKI